MGVCKYCGSTESLEWDHIVPRFRGGSNDSANLQRLCRDCHYAKSQRERREFNTGWTKSPETRVRISQSLKGHPSLVGNKWAAYPDSEETKARKREARLGPLNPQYGKPLTEEHKTKLREAWKRRTRSS